MTRLERHADKIGDRLATAVRDRDSSVDQLDRGRHTLGQPFPHAVRLTELTARLAELSAALATIDNAARTAAGGAAARDRALGVPVTPPAGRRRADEDQVIAKCFAARGGMRRARCSAHAGVLSLRQSVLRATGAIRAGATLDDDSLQFEVLAAGKDQVEVGARQTRDDDHRAVCDVGEAVE